MTAYEDMLKSVGEFGLYQKVRIFLFCLPAISAALHNMSMVFNMETPEFRCAVPGLPSDTYAVQSEHHAHLINASLPRDEKTGGYSRCYTYRPSAKNSLGPRSNRSGANETSQLIFDRNQTAPCERWVYSKDVHESTVTSHLNLVCERDGVRTHQSMMMLMGLLVGSLICTPLADWIGRKKVLIVCGLLQMVLGFCFVFITSVSWLLGLRFLIAITGLGTFFAGFVLSTEIVGPSHRAMAGVCAMYFWAVGMFLLVFLFYFIRDWRIAQVTLTAPGLLYISYWWIIPESPRWLILKGRHYEADKVLRSMATTNRRPVPEQMLNDLATSAETDVTKASLREEQQQQQQQQQRQQQGQNLRQQLWLLFSSPALAGRFLNLCFNWLAINVCYYGLTLNVGSLLEGELYFNFTLLTIMELAGFVVAHLLLDRLGRKPVYCCCMLLGGVACLATLGPVLTKSGVFHCFCKSLTSFSK
ncbi:organic cation transporter-like protein [Aplysia californica]|uniref:Organic cation transporter-like protein n=1 Tax=Aplysia californica TaxID=6500 RepID=A0ABM1A066_APLCA|nr:organic cation transporter-like protein [Aplysia californica]